MKKVRKYQERFFFDSLIENSIDLLRVHEPPEGYWLAFSGGKDSIVLKHLADMAGVKYRAVYNVTTIDPPEIIYFIRKYHSDVAFYRPIRPFLRQILIEGIPPFRNKPWCCRLYKESFKPDGILILGIRREESAKRRKRKPIEQCKNKETLQFLNPILDWASDEIWRFIYEQSISYCTLYDRDWKRIGCLFCPNATSQERKMQAIAYPKYANIFKKIFNLLYIQNAARGKDMSKWANGDEMFDWWIKG